MEGLKDNITKVVIMEDDDGLVSAYGLHLKGETFSLYTLAGVSIPLGLLAKVFFADKDIYNVMKKVFKNSIKYSAMRGSYHWSEKLYKVEVKEVVENTRNYVAQNVFISFVDCGDLFDIFNTRESKYLFSLYLNGDNDKVHKVLGVNDINILDFICVLEHYGFIEITSDFELLLSDVTKTMFDDSFIICDKDESVYSADFNTLINKFGYK